MKTNIKELNKRINQVTAEYNIERISNDVNLPKSYFENHFTENFGYKDIIDINDNLIESIEIFNGITAINFYSNEDIANAKKLYYKYLKEKNKDLDYDNIVKISLNSIEFELNDPIQYFLVALLKNGETISMHKHLEDYQIDEITNYIPEIFDLITKNKYEKRLNFEINKAFNIHYDTNIISFIDINGLDNFINHKKDDYNKLKQLNLYDKKPDSDWYDLNQKKYWWHVCHLNNKNQPRELEENFWAPYFIAIEDYGLYLVWISIKNNKYNLIEINGISNNEIPESLIRKVNETLEKENKEVQTN